MNVPLPTDVLPEVAEFLGESPLPGLIGGENVIASGDEELR